MNVVAMQVLIKDENRCVCDSAKINKVITCKWKEDSSDLSNQILYKGNDSQGENCLEIFENIRIRT